MNRLRSQPTSAETAATKQTGDAHFAVQTLFGSAITEFEDGTSPEARCARDADKLDCLLRALEYRAGGVPAVQGKIDRCRTALTTVAAQRIADAAPALDPTDWQYTWTSRSDVTVAEVSVSARLEGRPSRCGRPPCGYGVGVRVEVQPRTNKRAELLAAAQG